MPLDLNWKHGYRISPVKTDPVFLNLGCVSSDGKRVAFEVQYKDCAPAYGWASLHDGIILQGFFLNYSITPKPAPVREIWINVCEAEGLDRHVLSSYQTKRDAMNDSCWNRKKIACIKIQFTEGEGL